MNEDLEDLSVETYNSLWAEDEYDESEDEFYDDLFSYWANMFGG